MNSLSHTQSPYLDFAIYTGDFAAHGILDVQDGSPEEHHTQMIMDTVKRVAERMRESISPNVPIFPTLGNSDMPKRDYVMPLGNDGKQYLEQMLEDVFKPLAKVPTVEVNFDEFVSSGCGYYVVTKLPGLEKTRLIVYNSLFYSTHGGAADGNEWDKLGRQQFGWIKKQLEAARQNGDHAILVSHIPPITNERFGDQGLPQWESTYVDEFTDIVAEYQAMIPFQLYGHFHFETLRTMARRKTDQKTGLASDETLSALIIAPSISPFFTNNPSYRILYTDKKQRAVAESVTFFADLLEQKTAGEKQPLQWQMEHRQTVAFPGFKQIDASSLPGIFDEIFEDRRTIDEGATSKWNSQRTLSAYLLGQRAQYVPLKYQLECSYRYHRIDDVKDCLKRKPKFDRKTAPIV